MSKLENLSVRNGSRTLKWLRPSFLILVIAAVFVIGMAGNHGQAKAAGFTNKSIQGDWGFSASGTIVPPALPKATPAAAIGIMAFDGIGGCAISDTINIGGMSTSRTSTMCSYSVGSDGSGLISAFFPGDPGPTPLSFVLVNSAKEFHFIRTDLGVASGVAVRH